MDSIQQYYQISHILNHNDSGIWAPTPFSIAEQIAKNFGSASKTFVDLGSGDGRVVCALARHFSSCTGIEQDISLHKQAQKAKETLHLQAASFVCDDFLSQDLRSYDFVFIAPDKPFTLALENKLNAELKGLLIVFSDHFHPKLLKSTSQIGSLFTFQKKQ